MTLDRLFHLLAAAQSLSKHDDFVIVGSLSVLGVTAASSIPEAMTFSIDVDCFTRNDPGRVFDLVQQLGEHSEYRRQMGIYLDPISPSLPTLPDGWETRLLKIARGDLRAWFLEPNDAAVSKYARGEPRDARWIRAGIENGIVSLPVVKFRFAETVFLDDDERSAAVSRLEKDAAWFEQLRRPVSRGPRR